MTSYHNGRVTVLEGDCREVLAKMHPYSFDSAVVDPPYHFASIVKRFATDNSRSNMESGAQQPPNRGAHYKRLSRGFMGKQWDGGQIAHEPETWAAVLRVLKPGAHLVAFHAPKNWHRLALAIEDAGFEIRDTLLWLFGSGFPKSPNISVAIDKLNGVAPRSKAFNMKGRGDRAEELAGNGRELLPPYEAATEEARKWAGFGTSLKPAYEPICLARKPLERGRTIAGNVMAWGTGALNIDACRVATNSDDQEAMRRVVGFNISYSNGEASNSLSGGADGSLHKRDRSKFDPTKGRWPANIVHDGSPEVMAGFPETTTHAGTAESTHEAGMFGIETQPGRELSEGDSGSAARFFYTAKADADDRIGSRHPTVKPLDLLQWLCRLITPPKGHILDCFAGTGTTAEAALREGFRATLIEREAEYLADIDRRMALALEGSVGRSVAMAKLKPEGEPLPLFAEAAE